ncbi:hypothetical protein ASC80_02180 [Afipia sp. Root123D2]|nr:hypothetical protein ASC80_02180 [Afipia sp. Root123D2]
MFGGEKQNIICSLPFLAGPLCIRQRQNEVPRLVYGQNFSVVTDDDGLTKARRPLHGIRRNTHDTPPNDARKFFSVQFMRTSHDRKFA